MKKLLLFGALLFWLNGLIAQTNFINQDSIFARTANCDAGVAVCIDSFVYDSITNLRFYLDGRQFSGTFTACTIDTIHNYGYTDIFRGLERGPWRLDSWTVSGVTHTGTFPSLAILVDSMRLWDPSGDWRLEPISKTIFGFAKNGKQYSCQNITGLGRGGRSEICYNIGVEFKGLRFSVPAGVREFVVEKTRTGERDTVFLVAACVAPDTVRKTITLGAGQNYCFNTSQLLGTPGALVNFCSGPTTHTIFDAPENGCIRYLGASEGTDTACLSVCDQYGTCDTTILIVTAINPPTRTTIIQDTITVGLTRTHTGLVVPIGTLTAFENICPSSSGNNVSFTLNEAGRAVTFTGLTEGVDTACIRVCNALNICDTTIYYITALPVQNQPRVTTHIFTDTITVGLRPRSKCSFDGPAGTPTIIENLCAQSSGSNIHFTVDAVTKCVTYEGVSKGVDTACIRICNAVGQCDTTYMYVEALQTTVVPQIGKTVVINDTIESGTSRTRCNGTGLSFPTGTIATFQSLCGLGQFTFSGSFDYTNRCVTYTGLQRGLDSMCVLTCNTEGVCDTTILRITTIGGTQDSTQNLLLFGYVNTDDTECQLNLPLGRPVSIRNTCPQSAGQHVSVTLDTVNFCVKYRGIQETTPATVERACIEICDATGSCFKTNITFNILRQPRRIVIRDTITVGQTKVNCDSIANLASNQLIVAKDPTAPRNTNVTFKLDSANNRICMSYTGLRLGNDSTLYEIVRLDSFTYDTFVYIIHVRETANRIHEFRDTISMGLNRDKCDIVEPTGAVRIQNICEGQSGSNVDFLITSSTRCVNYMGVTPGTDTACIEICNAAGVCDTTYMYITTVDPQLLRGRFLTDSIIVQVGETKTYCADSSRVGASFFREFYNSNPTYSTINPIANACMTITGGIVGRDTAHIVLVGNGIKDTTRLFIIVVPPAVLPTPSVDTISLKIFETKAYCPDSSELRGSPIRYIGFCSIDPFDNTTVSLDTVRKCVNVRGISTGQDTFCLVLCNVAGFCDTTTLFVNVSQDTVLPSIKLDSVNIFVGDSLTYCGIDTLEIRGAVDSISNYCSQLSGINSTVEITASKCLNIKGLKEGVDTACIVVCNSLSGLCDTTRVIINVEKKSSTTPIPGIDSITVAVGQSKNYCPDTLQLSGSLINSIQFCTPLNADNATITLDDVTKCVKIVGNTEGRDTVCVLVCNTANVCDTTTLYVRVTPRDTSKPVSNTELITIALNADTTYCGVDSLQIQGAVDTIYDACSGKNGLHAFMVLDPDTKCVQITGRAIGIDTMCLVVHNRTSGLYDTTFIVVNVRDTNGFKIIAFDDFDTLRRGRSKDLFVYVNDTLSRSPTSLVITVPPTKGKADTISFQRGIISYTAGRAPSSCGLDSFTYRVCIDTVCDEATVTILVVCSDSLVVYNGISPNGDTKNHTWLIDGLQVYPNHTVCVFNRWGNEVFKTKDYKNDWDGTWNGKNLPDGTYFYWIRDDDKGEILKTGYLQLVR